MGEKVGHVMCEVNRGQGGVSNYGETDCKEKQTCVCVCTTEKVHKGMYKEYKQSINQNKTALNMRKLFRQPAY